MFIRIMAVVLGLVGLAGIGLALMSTQAPPAAPAPQLAAAPAAPPAPPAPKPHILVASRPLRAGALLLMEDLSAIEVPGGQEPAGSYPDAIGTRTALRGAMIRRSLNPNEPITKPDVLNPGDRGFLAAVLGTGMRAVTVGVDSVTGSAGLIWPGDRVDVVLTQSIDEKNQPVDRRVSGETILTNVRVIAVDQQLIEGGQGTVPGASSANNRTVTLETSAFDAARITVASRLGRISLVVRSAADDVQQSDSETPDALAAAATPAPAVAWSGDVSPALRGNNGVIRVNHGKDLEEVHLQ